MQYDIHPLCLTIPDMTEDEFQNLKSDIELTGLKQPITLFEGKILLGKNRYRACRELGLEPTFEDYTGDDPLGYIFSFSYYRTHFSKTQLVTIALEALEYQEKLAKQRQSEAAKRTNQLKKAPLEVLPTVEVQTPQASKKRAPQSRDIVAQKVGISGTSVGIGKMIRTVAPELHEQMKQGTLELSEAKILAKTKKADPDLYERVMQQIERFPELRHKAQTVVNAVRNQQISAENKRLTFETGKQFNVIYADPPWSYGPPPPGVAGIENHYPTMTIPEICALGDYVKSVSADDAVLFCWTSSPHLQLAFQVIEAWGFTYKTTFIWHKIKHNMGFYNSMRHEILLVCTKGSGLPERLKLEEDGYDTFHPEPSIFPSTHLHAKQFHMTEAEYQAAMEYTEQPMEPSQFGTDSVYEEARTVHSRKPKYYYDLINRLYPNGEKLEMFCREPYPGWTAWGNQSDGDDLAKKIQNA